MLASVMIHEEKKIGGLKLAGSLQMNIWSIEILNEVVMVRLD
jgi:hypothetical protein